MDTKKYVMKRFTDYRSKASKYANYANYNKSIYYLSKAALLMSNFNFIYSDDTLEDTLRKISRQIESEIVMNEKKHDRITILDGFGVSYRGLAWIYAKACLDLGLDVQYVVSIEVKNSKDFLPLQNYLYSQGVTISFYESLKSIHMAMNIASIINEYGSSTVLFHGKPNDSELILSVGALTGVLKILINLTDHTFWLGATVFDRFIEFRNYGYTISLLQRGIDVDKLFCLPYYPVQILLEVPFEGLPFPENCAFFLSGGSAYKIEGSTCYPFIVEEILKAHPELIFIFLSNDDAPSLDQLCQKYPKRIFCLPERSDLLELINRSCFYLSTYPLYGGLMTQIAAAAEKVPITLATKEHEPASSMLLDKSTVIDYSNVGDLLREVDLLSNDLVYRETRAADLKNAVMSPNLFAAGLNSILDNNNPYPMSQIEVSVEEFANRYVARAESFHKIAYINFSKDDLYHFTILTPQGVCGAVLHLLNKMKKHIRKI